MADLKLIYHDLIRFETELWEAIDARLRAACGLQLTWFEIMQVLSRRPSCRVQDLASEFSITVGGTSKVVDRVEAAGYCRRRANPDDRRSSIIELTPAGRNLLARATPVFEDELQMRIGAALPENSLQQFGATLTELRAAHRKTRPAQQPRPA